ncbi:Luciferase-like, subgroup [Actinoplanes friuliensis DSM 7358]|uniref:Luciferase-like, subgroup n=1 Tax=Actinoplanes friuliensis DSM 7358 TaxID=1246995 RepID=U5VV45_9ACTN|nr:Luciferase-like, subgroup [Actinoplanes friuliensis DSM 7358]
MTAIGLVEQAETEVVPVLRKEFAALKPAPVPDAPTHESLKDERGTGRAAGRRAARPWTNLRPGQVTGLTRRSCRWRAKLRW